MYFQRADRAEWPNLAVPPGEEDRMVKYIAISSYWLGVICAVVALVARMCDALGIFSMRFVTKGNLIDFRSFLDAALLFLFITIASASYASFVSVHRKP